MPIDWLKRTIIFICFNVLCLTVVSSSMSAQDRLRVYTVNYPLAYMAERIGQELVDVVFPAPPEVDPAFWMPDTETIIGYQKADLIFINGAQYAKWLDKVSLPKSRLVNTSKSVSDSYIQITEAGTHSHGPKGKHTHKGVAFTIWLDFDIVAHQAKAIADALAEKLPAQRVKIEANLSTLLADMKTLDDRLLALGQAHGSTPLIGSHPVYQYLARRYGFTIKRVPWEPEIYPNNRQIGELSKLIEHNPSKIMLWEKQPSEQTEQLLLNNEIASIVFDPCANRPIDGDFLDIFKKNIQALEASLSSHQ